MAMHKTLKTGSDPRMLPDFATLREEMSKLTHPARPDNLTPLMQQIRSALSRLKHCPLQQEATQGTALPEDVLVSRHALTPSDSWLVYVIHKAPDAEVQVTEAPAVKIKRWPAFVAGMGTAVVLSAVAVFGWKVVHQPDKAIKP